MNADFVNKISVHNQTDTDFIKSQFEDQFAFDFSIDIDDIPPPNLNKSSQCTRDVKAQRTYNVNVKLEDSVTAYHPVAKNALLHCGANMTTFYQDVKDHSIIFQYMLDLQQKDVMFGNINSYDKSFFEKLAIRKGITDIHLPSMRIDPIKIFHDFNIFERVKNNGDKLEIDDENHTLSIGDKIYYINSEQQKKAAIGVVSAKYMTDEERKFIRDIGKNYRMGGSERVGGLDVDEFISGDSDIDINTLVERCKADVNNLKIKLWHSNFILSSKNYYGFDTLAVQFAYCYSKYFIGKDLNDKTLCIISVLNHKKNEFITAFKYIGFIDIVFIDHLPKIRYDYYYIDNNLNFFSESVGFYRPQLAITRILNQRHAISSVVAGHNDAIILCRMHVDNFNFYHHSVSDVYLHKLRGFNFLCVLEGSSLVRIDDHNTSIKRIGRDITKLSAQIKSFNVKKNNGKQINDKLFFKKKQQLNALLISKKTKMNKIYIENYKCRDRFIKAMNHKHVLIRSLISGIELQKHFIYVLKNDPPFISGLDNCNSYNLHGYTPRSCRYSKTLSRMNLSNLLHEQRGLLLDALSKIAQSDDAKIAMKHLNQQFNPDVLKTLTDVLNGSNLVKDYAGREEHIEVLRKNGLFRIIKGVIYVSIN